MNKITTVGVAVTLFLVVGLLSTVPIWGEGARPVFESTIVPCGPSVNCGGFSQNVATMAPVTGKVMVLGNGAVSVEDRKSTRLNSSHVRISYAVFCLKKKKKTTLAECEDIGKTPTLSKEPADTMIGSCLLRMSLTTAHVGIWMQIQECSHMLCQRDRS